MALKVYSRLLCHADARVPSTELTFRLSATPRRGQFATRKFDHWDVSTGTGYEFNTTPWGYVSAKRLKEKIMSKLDQGNGDFALLNDHDLLRRKFPANR